MNIKNFNFSSYLNCSEYIIYISLEKLHQAIHFIMIIIIIIIVDPLCYKVLSFNITLCLD